MTAAPDPEIEELLRIARAASDIVLSVYSTPFRVEMKSPGDPVTEADKRANELLCREISASFPGECIVAEEDAPIPEEALRERTARERVFFVDPLDGTREFTDRCPEFSVMIGLAVKGRATLGVLVMPTSGDALFGDARRPGTALIESKTGVRAPLRVTDLSDPTKARLVVSRSRRPGFVAPMSERLKLASITPCGSVGVKIARVALGQADLYVHGGGGIKSWDLCGPEAVLWAAGGRATTLGGEPVDYSGAVVHAKGFVATNGPLHDTVVRTIREVGG